MKHFESFGLDTVNGCLWRDGAQIDLPPKPFAVLRYMVENPGRLITHDELLDALWPETYVQPQVLRTYVLELRKLLGDSASQPRFIQTLPKRGYRFIASVTEREDIAGSVPAPVNPGTLAAESVQAISARAIQELAFPGPEGIVGRDAELACLQHELERVCRGQRRTVIVTGETGMGKTALVDAFCRQASSALPITITRGQCIQGIGAQEEYYPVMDALNRLCAGQEGETVCRILARMAPAWLARLGRQTGICDSPAGSAAQERQPGDLCRAIEELAANKPLLLVFEDLHWADEATLDLLSALVRGRAPARLMLVATFRPRSAAAAHCAEMLRQDLRVRRLCTEVVLEPLTRTAVGQLLEQELQLSLPQGLAEFVHRQSEGNTLFAIAILEHLLAMGLLVRNGPNGASHWAKAAPLRTMEAGVPRELAQLIELEIERITPAEQQILEAGSLMDVAFPAWAVAAALAIDPAEAEEACDSLARRLYFVERVGEDVLPDGSASSFYAFTHGLYREVLYQRQASARRAQRHIRVAEQLDRIFAGHASDVGREIAWHYEAAGSWQGASAALHAAAYQALQRDAVAEAADLLEQAVRVVEHLAGEEREPVAAGLRAELENVREALPKALSEPVKTA